MVLQITGIPSCLPWCKNKKNMFFTFQRQQNRLHYSFYIILTLLSQVPTLTQPCFGSTLLHNVKNVLFFCCAECSGATRWRKDWSLRHSQRHNWLPYEVNSFLHSRTFLKRQIREFRYSSFSRTYFFQKAVLLACNLFWKERRWHFLWIFWYNHRNIGFYFLFLGFEIL